MPRHKNRVNFDPDTKSKSFSTATKKTSWFRSLHWNQVNLDHPHNQINIIPTLKASQVPSTALKSSQFGPYTQKTSQFRCSHENQVISCPHTKTTSFLTTHTKIKSIDPHTKNKEFSARKQKTNQFRSILENQAVFGRHIFDPPGHKDEVNFDPDSKQSNF